MFVLLQDVYGVISKGCIHHLDLRVDCAVALLEVHSDFAPVYVGFDWKGKVSLVNKTVGGQSVEPNPTICNIRPGLAFRLAFLTRP